MCLWSYVSLCQSSCFMRFWLCPAMSLCACGVICELLYGYRPLVVCTILLFLWVHITMDAADIAVQFIWLCVCPFHWREAYKILNCTGVRSIVLVPLNRFETWWWPLQAETCSFIIECHIFFASCVVWLLSDKNHCRSDINHCQVTKTTATGWRPNCS
jgi:hypothetical protein